MEWLGTRMAQLERSFGNLAKRVQALEAKAQEPAERRCGTCVHYETLTSICHAPLPDAVPPQTAVMDEWMGRMCPAWRAK